MSPQNSQRICLHAPHGGFERVPGALEGEGGDRGEGSDGGGGGEGTHALTGRLPTHCLALSWRRRPLFPCGNGPSSS